MYKYDVLIDRVSDNRTGLAHHTDAYAPHCGCITVWHARLVVIDTSDSNLYISEVSNVYFICSVMGGLYNALLCVVYWSWRSNIELRCNA